MKTKTRISAILLSFLAAVLLLCTSCGKEEEEKKPKVITDPEITVYAESRFDFPAEYMLDTSRGGIRCYDGRIYADTFRLLEKRRKYIEKYDAALRPLGVHTLNHFTDEHISSGHLYITRIPGINELERRLIIGKLAKVGVTANVHYKPLPMMTAYKHLGFNIEDFPNAKAFYESEITLPLYTKLTEEDVDYIIENYSSVLKEYL